jgi:hypothetical protein
MKKIIFIYGPQASGKTLTARAIIEAVCPDYFNYRNNIRIDKKPISTVQTDTDVISFLDSNKRGELPRHTARSTPGKSNLVVIEDYKFYGVELDYIVNAIGAIQFVFTSHNPPPVDLLPYVIVLHAEPTNL